MRHRAKFRASRLNRYGDMTIFYCWVVAVFRFFKKAAVCHLGSFKIRNFNCWSGLEGHLAWLCHISCPAFKPLRRYGHFSIFQDGRSPSWIFKVQNFMAAILKIGWPICVNMTNFVPIEQTVAEMWTLFLFSKMAAVRHHGFLKFRILNTGQILWENVCQHVCQILCWLVKPFRSFNRFSIFPDGGRVPSCIF